MTYPLDHRVHTGFLHTQNPRGNENRAGKPLEPQSHVGIDVRPIFVPRNGALYTSCGVLVADGTCGAENIN
jgi:hypothetical protein